MKKRHSGKYGDLLKNIFGNTFKDKTILVTGHTGFKGSWLSIWLDLLGANVIGYALDPISERTNYNLSGIKNRITDIRSDIRDYDNLLSVFKKYNPEIVFHLAAQPLIQLSYDDPKLTYDTNVGGTVNLFEACRLTNSVKVIINITSDKCYENNEWIWGYRENDEMGGSDPYSSSKGCSELVTATYRRSFFKGGSNKFLASARAGNVIGGGDWSQLRIIPDCIKALERNQEIEIRNPYAVRPWQYVLEPLAGYILLAKKILKFKYKFTGAWNFGPNLASCVTVKFLVEKVIKLWGYGKYRILNNQSNKKHEAKLLMLDTSKAFFTLGWQPVLDINECLNFTLQYYKTKVDYNYCINLIEKFSELYISKSKRD